MELSLTDDQELLRETAVKYMESACPLETIRQLIETSPSDMPETYLSEVAELGWFSLLVPEELGGGSVSGEGLRDAAVVAEERGCRLQPGPFVNANVVASALAAAGTGEHQRTVLPAVVGGEAVAAWVSTDAQGRFAPGASITATPSSEGFVLSGRAKVVQGAPQAQWFVVVASGKEGLSQFLVSATHPGVSVAALDSHDLTQRQGTLELRQVTLGPESLLGPYGGADEEVERLFQVALVLVVAETVGALEGLFELTRQYALDRFAFGRPIGSFQGLKYQLAEMALALEAARAISVSATTAVQRAQLDAGEIACMAKAWLGDVGIDIAQGCFQIFGGIGYTWEHDLHLYLRRITMNGVLLGDADFHRERICQIHGLGAALLAAPTGPDTPRQEPA